MSKRCSKCHKNLAPDDFYADKSKHNSLSSSCKSCTRSAVKAYQESAQGQKKRAEWEARPGVKEASKERQKMRMQTPEFKINRKQYRLRPDVREKENAYTREYNRRPETKEIRETYLKSNARKEARQRYAKSEKGLARARELRRKHPNEARARSAVNHAIRDGRLFKGCCAEQNSECDGPIQAHHHLGYDHEHRLDVIWLCRIHHQHAHSNTLLTRAT